MLCVLSISVSLFPSPFVLFSQLSAAADIAAASIAAVAAAAPVVAAVTAAAPASVVAAVAVAAACRLPEGCHGKPYKGLDSA